VLPLCLIKHAKSNKSIAVYAADLASEYNSNNNSNNRELENEHRKLK
jgi:hypothetical protein